MIEKGFANSHDWHLLKFLFVNRAIKIFHIPDLLTCKATFTTKSLKVLYGFSSESIHSAYSRVKILCKIHKQEITMQIL